MSKWAFKTRPVNLKALSSSIKESVLQCAKLLQDYTVAGLWFRSATVPQERKQVATTFGVVCGEAPADGSCVRMDNPLSLGLGKAFHAGPAMDKVEAIISKFTGIAEDGEKWRTTTIWAKLSGKEGLTFWDCLGHRAHLFELKLKNNEKKIQLAEEKRQKTKKENALAVVKSEEAYSRRYAKRSRVRDSLVPLSGNPAPRKKGFLEGINDDESVTPRALLEGEFESVVTPAPVPVVSVPAPAPVPVVAVSAPAPVPVVAVPASTPVPVPANKAPTPVPGKSPTNWTDLSKGQQQAIARGAIKKHLESASKYRGETVTFKGPMLSVNLKVGTSQFLPGQKHLKKDDKGRGAMLRCPSGKPLRIGDPIHSYGEKVYLQDNEQPCGDCKDGKDLVYSGEDDEKGVAIYWPCVTCANKVVIPGDSKFPTYVIDGTKDWSVMANHNSLDPCMAITYFRMAPYGIPVALFFAIKEQLDDGQWWEKTWDYKNKPVFMEDDESDEEDDEED